MKKPNWSTISFIAAVLTTATLFGGFAWWLSISEQIEANLFTASLNNLDAAAFKNIFECKQVLAPLDRKTGYDLAKYVCYLQK